MPDPSSAIAIAPPPKDAKPTAANVQQLENWLASITAFRAYTSQRPWTFYEEIDGYLGPWGESGYPIAYGKKYCILFSQDVQLNSDEAGRVWVRRTLLLLQNAIKDYMLKRFRDGNLGRIREPELRKAAFDSHPAAYTQGGLTMVSLISAKLLPHISRIPAAEFNPLARSFGPSVVQFVVTGGLMVPQVLGYLLGTIAGSAHTGVLAGAFASDQQRFANEQQLGQSIAEATRIVDAGYVDHVGLLERMRASIVGTEMPNEGLATLTRQLINTIDSRKSLVMQRYRREVVRDHRLLDVFKIFDRKAF